jgi:hypothetical protein
MIRVKKDSSNVINIDYFKLDFNRDTWTALFKPGLTFGAILFIIINKASSPISLPQETVP